MFYKNPISIAVTHKLFFLLAAVVTTTKNKRVMHYILRNEKY